MKSKCIVTKNGKQFQEDSQVIGWDPQHNTIISWHFDSNGGFGSGTWSKQPDEKKWTVSVAGVGADGSNSIASNVFTMKSADEFIWQSVHRTLDGGIFIVGCTRSVELQPFPRNKHCSR